ncbi:MAG TPA: GAF domain-containing SpoIIE family protein phosphatase, partial [Tepidisphaeraceae bacterium]|nr:GAF domain-containing SpoIIE family protein phosphatase [Tepidisphaeraceae bacterium]
MLTTKHSPDFPKRPWDERLADDVQAMREISRQSDPQTVVKMYAARMREFTRADGMVALSRRDLVAPQYRITRSSIWGFNVDPWKTRVRVIHDRGILGDLLYADEPVILDDFQADPTDPAYEHLAGHRSLVAVPLFEKGVGMNMVVLLHKEPAAFDRERFPEYVWMSNLFGRATHNMVLGEQLREAYNDLDRELLAVADIQRALLPTTLPSIPGLDLASSYQTSRRAGGDYYDFFQLPNGKWGILVADVSGHGTPAAVLMAVTHSIAHTLSAPPDPPSKLLSFINYHLAARYTGSGNFVTAFYGIYEPATRKLLFSSAGHPPPRVRQCGGDFVRPILAKQRSLPLGIDLNESYVDTETMLTPGDIMVMYTDGITEARSSDGDMFGVERLDLA